MLRFLAGDSPAAKALLRKFIFRITPVVDISGWRFGKQTNPLRSGSIDFNYNRDWGIFSLPEVKAIDRYLRECMDNGERLAFLADLHGGTGDENDYTSGAGISFDSRASEPVLAQQRHFVDLVRQNCVVRRCGNAMAGILSTNSSMIFLNYKKGMNTVSISC